MLYVTTPILKNPTLNNTLKQQGIVALPPVAKHDILKLTEIFKNFHNTLDPTFYQKFHVGIHSNDFDYKNNLHQAIAPILDPYIEKYFTHYKRLIWTMQIKGTGQNSLVPLHQDWSIVDERHFSSLTFWIPLTDTTPENGCIYAIPYSHLLPCFPRGLALQGKYDTLHEHLKPYMVPFPCPAGTILVFDNRILHYSPYNATSNFRISTITLLIPEKAKPVLYFRNINKPNTPVEVYDMNQDFYLHFKDFITSQNSSPPPNGIKRNINLPFKEYNPTLNKVLRQLFIYKNVSKLYSLFNG